MKKLASLFAALALLLALAAPGAAAEAQPQTGRIYLYGETHADPACLAQELDAWPGRAITAISGCGTSSSRCRPTRPPL